MDLFFTCISRTFIYGNPFMFCLLIAKEQGNEESIFRAKPETFLLHCKKVISYNSKMSLFFFLTSMNLSVYWTDRGAENCILSSFVLILWSLLSTPLPMSIWNGSMGQYSHVLYFGTMKLFSRV